MTIEQSGLTGRVATAAFLLSHVSEWTTEMLVKEIQLMTSEEWQLFRHFFTTGSFI